ncbi:MAG: FecR family protein [Chitinophagaceae bacterium]|nr:FecR family protein [Chitinophagaceae bacterium]MCW5926372.1 FecR family protein [Chitinophagaceae bacterium]
MNEQRFWELVSLKLSREASKEELTELETLLFQHPEMALQVDVIAGIWNEKTPTPDLSYSFEKHLQKLEKLSGTDSSNESYEIPPSIRKKQPLQRYLLLAAASIAIFFLFRIFFFSNSEKIPPNRVTALNTITVPRGSKKTIELPDGTKVWLNADSRLEYNELFECDLREVTLEGEAFFDVWKDSCRPFVIHTSAIDITVLGTSFNVRAYNNENETETSLVTGKVEIVVKNNPEKKIILRPNEKLVIMNNAYADSLKNTQKADDLLIVKTMRKDPVYNAVPETMWIDNKLAFDGEKLEEVCKKLERWYNVAILIKDESLKEEVYTAIFEGETLLNVLTALKISARIDFEIQENIINIFRNPNDNN